MKWADGTVNGAMHQVAMHTVHNLGVHWQMLDVMWHYYLAAMHLKSRMAIAA
jgi:hypothetical protein